VRLYKSILAHLAKLSNNRMPTMQIFTVQKRQKQVVKSSLPSTNFRERERERERERFRRNKRI
jgi:hypothetical protein